MLGKLRQLARHAVVKANAERQEQVRIVDSHIAVDGAVHPEHLQTEVVICWEAAQAVDGQADRDA